MEKAQLVKRQQHFQEQFAALDNELRALNSQQPLVNDPDTSSKRRRAVSRRCQELQYELGQLCAEHGECQLALLYFQRLVDELKLSTAVKEEPKGVDEIDAPDQQAELAALCVNVLNCLAALQFRQGDQAKAMALLLEAKQLHREATTSSSDATTSQSTRANINLLDKPLAANYALLLHAKGSVQDAIQVAQSVLEAPAGVSHPSSDAKYQIDGFQASQESIAEAKAVDAAARSTACMLLAGCVREQNERSTEAFQFAELAVEEADQSVDAEVQCRAHNNLGLYYFERGEPTAALPHFVAAFRAALRCGDLHLQAISKYHLGVVMAHVDARDIDALGKDAFESSESELMPLPADNTPAEDLHHGGEASAVTSTDGGEDQQHSSPAISAFEPASMPTRTPKDWFLQSESLADALPEPDHRLGVLAHGCRGEKEYHTSEFHTAEAEFTIALKRLKELLRQPALVKDGNNSASDEYSVTEPIDMVTAREMDPELAKLQGFLLSYLGCTLLVEGRFNLAERAHQSDLALAMEREDVFAQQRALRNLAMVFNCTQRYAEAIPMWRDAFDTATVLQNKADQMMALSGLGTALKEFQMFKRASAFSASPTNDEGDDDSSLRAPPLPVFLRQRALAVELGDRHQHVLAQRHIVSVYESHTHETSDSKTESGAVEKWLAECDALVRLCEQYENLQYLADAYRSLANALTAQLARLRSRGAARFADAIAVLSQKRDSVCNKFQDATAALALATAVVFHNNEQEGAMPLELKERQSRAAVVRVDVLPRR